MSVLRVNKTKDFTVMRNYLLRDKNLSMEAKGLLNQMISLPDLWDYTEINKESKTVIQGVLEELEQNGYLVRTRNQNAKGQFEYVYDICEVPVLEEPETEKPQMENMCTEEMWSI